MSENKIQFTIIELKIIEKKKLKTFMNQIIIFSINNLFYYINKYMIKFIIHHIRLSYQIYYSSSSRYQIYIKYEPQY